ncbi:MAG: hypothetical protein U0441_29460 [Polyangiaceae bacterium]
MVVTSASKIDWRPAGVRRARPVRARGFGRAALVIAAVALSVEALPTLAGREAGAQVAAALPFVRALYAVAIGCAAAALVETFGIGRALSYAIDRRSFFVGTPRSLRRIPRWQVVTAVARPPDRRVVHVALSTGEIFRLRVRDEEEARSVAATLAASPRRRQSDDD